MFFLFSYFFFTYIIYKVFDNILVAVALAVVDEVASFFVVAVVVETVALIFYFHCLFFMYIHF